MDGPGKPPRRRPGPKGDDLVAFSAATTGTGEQTYYELLGVDISATLPEITRAYRQMMKDCHPDRQPPAERERTEALCKNINLAYAILKDPLKRKQYDDTIRAQQVQEQIMNRYVGGFAGPGIAGFDPHAGHLRREETPFEKAERLQANRSAMFSLLRAVFVLAVVVVALLIAMAVVMSVAGLLT
jgi:curved DNA-binding protein CbpA